ncbi:hypothetical protein D9M72_606570 [compost metagenome]
MHDVEGFAHVRLVDILGGEHAALLRRQPAWRRQCGDQLFQRRIGRGRECAAAPGLQQPQAGHQRFDLHGTEHQRRDIEIGAQPVADAGLALDRHA